jgi:hypothetical protein
MEWFLYFGRCPKPQSLYYLFIWLCRDHFVHLAAPSSFRSFGFAELVTMHGMVPRFFCLPKCFLVLSLFVQRLFVHFLLAQRSSCSFFVRPKKEPKKGRRKGQLQPFNISGRCPGPQLLFCLDTKK